MILLYLKCLAVVMGAIGVVAWLFMCIVLISESNYKVKCVGLAAFVLLVTTLLFLMVVA